MQPRSQEKTLAIYSQLSHMTHSLDANTWADNLFSTQRLSLLVDLSSLIDFANISL